MTTGGARNIELRHQGQPLVGLKAGNFGPMKRTETTGYSTTMALSVLRHLLVTKKLRAGDGPIEMPDSRRRERLLDSGRTKSLASGIKWEKFGDDYDPVKDTCIKAFVRLLALAAQQQLS